MSRRSLNHATLAVFAILFGMYAVGGGTYWIGQKAGEHFSAVGVTQSEYQVVKWSLRGGALGVLGLPVGGIFLVGLENKFYSLVT